MGFEVEGENVDWKTSQDKQALVRFANVLDVKTDGRAGLETIRKQIATKLGETLEEQTPLPELPQAPKPAGPVSFASMKRQLNQCKKYVVIISSTDRDPYPAEGGVNGVMYAVKRDVEQILPEPMVRQFQKAIETRYRWSNEKMHNVPVRVPMYPISVIREATEEDLADEKLNAQGQAQQKVVG